MVLLLLRMVTGTLEVVAAAMLAVVEVMAAVAGTPLLVTWAAVGWKRAARRVREEWVWALGVPTAAAVTKKEAMAPRKVRVGALTRTKERKWGSAEVTPKV